MCLCACVCVCVYLRYTRCGRSHRWHDSYEPCVFFFFIAFLSKKTHTKRVTCVTEQGEKATTTTTYYIENRNTEWGYKRNYNSAYRVVNTPQISIAADTYIRTYKHAYKYTYIYIHIHAYVCRLSSLAMCVSFKARFTVIIVVIVRRQQPNEPPSDFINTYVCITV